MPSTPTYALPYPASTNVPDVPTDIAALANQIEALKMGSGAQLGYWETTANVSVTGTSDATATPIVAGAAVTYTADPIMVEFGSPFATLPTAAWFLFIVLFDGTTALGRLGVVQAPINGGGNGIYGRARLTPSAGSHTYNVKGVSPSGTATIYAGTGAASAYYPTFLRITRSNP